MSMKDTELAQKSYLDCKDVEDKGLCDLICKGGVVCLGTLARHLHGDLKRVWHLLLGSPPPEPCLMDNTR